MIWEPRPPYLFMFFSHRLYDACAGLLSAGTASAFDAQDVLVQRSSVGRVSAAQVLRQDVAYLTCLEKPTLRGLRTRAIPAGVNSPPLQTTSVKVVAIVLFNQSVKHFLKVISIIPAKEIHEDSLKKKTAFSACDVFQGSFPYPAGKRRR